MSINKLIENSTCHGLSSIGLCRSGRSKFFWTLTSLAATLLMFWMIRINIKEYQMHKTVMTQTQIIENSIDFPTITICSGNQLKLKLLDKYKKEDKQLKNMIESVMNLKKNNLDIRGKYIATLYYDVLGKINNFHVYSNEYLPPTHLTKSDWERIQRIYGFFSFSTLTVFNCVNCFKIISRCFLRFSNIINYLNLTTDHKYQSAISYDEIMEDEIAMKLTRSYYKKFSGSLDQLLKNPHIHIMVFYANFRRIFGLGSCRMKKNYTINLFEYPKKNFLKNLKKNYGTKPIPLQYFYDIHIFLCSFMKVFSVPPHSSPIEKQIVRDMKQIVDYFQMFYIDIEAYIWNGFGNEIRRLIGQYNKYFPNFKLDVQLVSIALNFSYVDNRRKAHGYSIRQLTNEVWRFFIFDRDIKYKMDNIGERNYSLRNILEEDGWNLNGDIVFCKFAQKLCKSNVFQKVYTSNGLCYQIDTSKKLTINGDNPLRQEAPGTAFGFELRFVDSQASSDSSDIFTNNILISGIRLYIHSPLHIPSKELKGIVLKKNYRYNIRIEMEEVKLIDREDYCNSNSNYSYSNCYDDCIQSKLEDMCGCRLYTNPSKCSTLNHIYCLFASDHPFFRKENKERLCPFCLRKCHSTNYLIKDISSSKLSLYDDAFNSYTNGSGRRAILSKHQYQVSVYFGDIGHRLLKEQILISKNSLFPLIGGTMCFCIGIKMSESILKKINSADLIRDFEITVNTLNGRIKDVIVGENRLENDRQERNEKVNLPGEIREHIKKRQYDFAFPTKEVKKKMEELNPGFIEERLVMNEQLTINNMQQFKQMYFQQCDDIEILRKELKCRNRQFLEFIIRANKNVRRLNHLLLPPTVDQIRKYIERIQDTVNDELIESYMIQAKKNLGMEMNGLNTIANNINSVYDTLTDTLVTQHNVRSRYQDDEENQREYSKILNDTIFDAMYYLRMAENSLRLNNEITRNNLQILNQRRRYKNLYIGYQRSNKGKIFRKFEALKAKSKELDEYYREVIAKNMKTKQIFAHRVGILLKNFQIRKTGKEKHFYEVWRMKEDVCTEKANRCIDLMMDIQKNLEGFKGQNFHSYYPERAKELYKRHFFPNNNKELNTKNFLEEIKMYENGELSEGRPFKMLEQFVNETKIKEYKKLLLPMPIVKLEIESFIALLKHRIDAALESDTCKVNAKFLRQLLHNTTILLPERIRRIVDYAKWGEQSIILVSQILDRLKIDSLEELGVLVQHLLKNDELIGRKELLDRFNEYIVNRQIRFNPKINYVKDIKSIEMLEHRNREQDNFYFNAYAPPDEHSKAVLYLKLFKKKWMIYNGLMRRRSEIIKECVELKKGNEELRLMLQKHTNSGREPSKTVIHKRSDCDTITVALSSPRSRTLNLTKILNVE
ncbi:hypothetical protein SNEBB_005248 [Seison nebaliae]|nr:hypothetical protein SNEBB_005248 [Seison nebaliae]